MIIKSNNDILQIIHKITADVLQLHQTGLDTIEDAKHFLKFYELIHISKDGRVTKKNKHRDYFIKKKTSLDYLFKVTLEGNRKKRLADGFTSTDLCNDVIAIVYKQFSSLRFTNTDISVDPKNTFSISPRILSSIKYSDRVILMHNLLTYTNNRFIIDLNKDEKDGNGRVYSTFTKISSDTRKLLGYINYDMDTAMQAITLQLTVDSSKYPFHKELVNDKRAFRAKFAEDANICVEEAKELLTSLDNKTTFKGNGHIGKAYVAEAVMIHKEVLQRTISIEPALYNRCDKLAKYSKYDKVKKKKNPYSTYFHIWTSYEKLIRDSIKSCFEKAHMTIDLHDAIYSKEDVSLERIEEVVLETTGFRIKISH